MKNSMLSAYYEVKMKLLKYAIEQNGGYLVVKVFGDSMEPVIYSNEDIIVEKNDGSFKVGDILLCYDESYRLFLHRVKFISDNIVCLQGENADTLDRINSEKILAKYCCKYSDKLIKCPKNTFVINLNLLSIKVNEGTLEHYMLNKMEI